MINPGQTDVFVPLVTRRVPGTQEGGKKCSLQWFSNVGVLQSHALEGWFKEVAGPCPQGF